MPFPLIPVLVTAGIGGLGYLLFKPEQSAGGGAGTLGENTKPGQPTAPGQVPPFVPGVYPKPKPMPVPIPGNLPAPMPIPNVIQPIPIPNVAPSGPYPLPPPPMPLPNILPIPQPTPITPSEQTGVVVAPSGINLRSGPSASAGILYGMVAGTRVKILSYDSTPTPGAPKGWYRVTAPNGMTGYCTGEFLLPDSGANPVPVPIPIPIPNMPVIPSNVIPGPPTGMTAKVLGNPGTNLRASPSATGTLIKGLFNGSIVTVLSATKAPATAGAPQGWVNVRDSAGATGWMSRQYLEPQGGASFGMTKGSSEYRNRKKTAIRG